MEFAGVSHISTFINVLLYRNTSIPDCGCCNIFRWFKSLNHIVKEIKKLHEVREISMNKNRR